MKHLFPVTALLFLLTACGGGGNTPPEPKIEPKVDPATRVVTPETREALTQFDFTNAAACNTRPDPIKKPKAEPEKCTAKLVFSKNTPYLASLKVGDIMVSEIGPSAKYGYLQRVTKITPMGDKVEVQTQSASLNEALIEGEFDQQGVLDPSKLASMSLKQGVVPAGTRPGQFGPQAKSFAFDINTVLFDADDNLSTTNDQVRLKGNFNLGVDDGLSYNLKWKKVLGVPIYPNGIYVRMAYGFNQSANVRVEVDLNTTIEKEVELASYTFSPITFFIGPVPVVLIPTVRVTADMKGNISAKMTFGASENVTALAGFEYNNGFKNITDFKLGYDKYSDIQGVKGEVDAGLNIQGEILLYGLVGPYARVRGNIVMKAQIPGDPVWTLKAGVKGLVGIHADLLVKTLDYHAEVFNKDLFEIGRAGNVQPEVQFISPSNGQEYSQNVFIKDAICVSINDPESSQVGLRISSNLDGELLSSNPIRGNFGKVCVPGRTFATLGTRTLTAEITDSGGLKATATRTISIVNNPPSVLIAKPSNNQTVPVDTDILLQGSMVDPNETLPCTSFKWSSSNALDTMPANNCGDVVAKFATQGARTLKLEVTDSGAKTGFTTINVNVGPKPATMTPEVKITDPVKVPEIPGNDGIPVLPEIYTSMTAKGLIIDNDSATVTYTWKFSFTRNGVGPYIQDIETKNVSLSGGKFYPTVTFKPSDFLGISGGGEFKCYNADNVNLRLMLVVDDGKNSSTFFVPMKKGCVG